MRYFVTTMILFFILGGVAYAADYMITLNPERTAAVEQEAAARSQTAAEYLQTEANRHADKLQRDQAAAQVSQLRDAYKSAPPAIKAQIRTLLGL